MRDKTLPKAEGRGRNAGKVAAPIRRRSQAFAVRNANDPCIPRKRKSTTMSFM